MEKAAQFPGMEQEEGEVVSGLELADVDRDESSNNDLWICEVCAKEFNSKKSLGGHKRVHAQLQKSSKKTPATLKIEEPSSCKVCDKRFTSQWSLWGHMRSHTNKALKSDAERQANEEEAVYALMLLATEDERCRIRSNQEEEEEKILRKRKREEMKENGGHQRCHWRGSYGSSSSAADGGEGGGGGRSSDDGKTVVFDFDLNELPPEEEDGDDDQPAEI